MVVHYLATLIYYLYMNSVYYLESSSSYKYDLPRLLQWVNPCVLPTIDYPEIEIECHSHFTCFSHSA